MESKTIEINLDEYEPMIVVTFKLPLKKLRELDEVWKKLGFETRSEFIRSSIDFALSRIEEFKKFIEMKNTSVKHRSTQ